MSAALSTRAEERPRDATEGSDAGAHQYARVFRRVLLWLFVAWFAVLVVVDPRREFFGSPFPAVTPNTRADKLARLQQFAATGPVNTIVFGSSRTFAIDPADLRTRGYGRSFSLTVHGGGVRDLLSLYREARRLGVQPDTVILGVDLTWLSRSFDDAYELRHNRTLQAALSPDGRPPSRAAHAWSLVERMLTPGYALDARRSILGWLRGGPPQLETDSTGRTWRPQGDALIAEGGEDVVGALQESAQSAVPPLIAYAGPDSSRVAVFLAFLRELTSDQVEVHAYLTPYHPLALDAIRSRPRARDGFDRSRGDVQALFGRAGVPLLDLTDPEPVGATAHEWYDANHMQAPNGARVIDVLRRRGL